MPRTAKRLDLNSLLRSDPPRPPCPPRPKKLQTGKSIAFGVLSCFLFAVYWAMIPGGVVRYTGAIYGLKTLGRIWGLATLICMGVGPAAGSFLGGYFRDLTESYRASFLFALGSFLVSALAASSLPLAATLRHGR